MEYEWDLCILGRNEPTRKKVFVIYRSEGRKGEESGKEKRKSDERKKGRQAGQTKEQMTNQQEKVKVNELPPDVAAYLVNAAVDVASKQCFIPGSEEHLRQWLDGNARLIGERAIELMDNLRCRLLDNPQIMNQVQQVLASNVHRSINLKPVRPTWNPRYVSYAKSRGKTPDEMFKLDGGRMTNFLYWKG